MTDKQRFLIYAKLGNLIADVRENNEGGEKMSICKAVEFLLDNKIIEKLEDLETGFYLESSAYLAEALKIAK
jgi:hypothetical protein